MIMFAKRSLPPSCGAGALPAALARLRLGLLGGAVLLGKPLVAQELGVHALERLVLVLLDLLDAVAVVLVRLVVPRCPRSRSMAKSTNHTAHNQSYKNHRNGIKKPMKLGKGQRRPLKGVSDATSRLQHAPHTT